LFAAFLNKTFDSSAFLVIRVLISTEFPINNAAKNAVDRVNTFATPRAVNREFVLPPPIPKGPALSLFCSRISPTIAIVIKQWITKRE
jgi:hypothetical protein